MGKGGDRGSKDTKGKAATGSGKQKAGPAGTQNRQMDTSRAKESHAGSGQKQSNTPAKK
jgi:hypothetical protein